MKILLDLDVDNYLNDTIQHITKKDDENQIRFVYKIKFFFSCIYQSQNHLIFGVKSFTDNFIVVNCKIYRKIVSTMI